MSAPTVNAQGTAPDAPLLFATRALRLFGYGLLSVVLVLYLVAAGLRQEQVGLLLTLTLVGDALLSLWITTQADHVGRRRMLLAGAGLMVFAGVLFALPLVAATIGVISPSGNEVGPFLAIEQAALAEQTPAARRTSVFAWYNLTGSFATALGALASGALVQLLQAHGASAVASYRAVVVVYAALGAVMAVLFLDLTAAVEAPASDRLT